MKDIEKILLNENNMSKEMLKKKNDDIIDELNSFKKELLIDSEIDEFNTSEMLFKYDDEQGYMFNREVKDEELDVIKDVLLSDPVFALKFLERKKDMMTLEEYDTLEKAIVGKLNL